MATPTVHASAVLVGARAVLIQGPSGSGKSSLAWALLQAAERGELRFARLVGDDRVHLEATHGRLLVRPASVLEGQIEVRGLGIRRMPHEPVAVVGLLVELGAATERLPEAEQQEALLSGVRLPRLAVAAGVNPLPLLMAHFRTDRCPV
jgi:HPr kinase/phosphorylase